MDSLESSAERIAAAWAERYRTMEAERDALRTEVSLLTTEVSALRESLNAAGVAATMYRQANEGLRRALRSRGVENTVLRIAVAGVVAKLAYDALSGGG